MPLVATRGAASAQGFGEFAQTAVATYIEDVFSTYLYTGNSSTQTITNGIDLSTYGGLVWFKCRTLASNNRLTDTVRGAGNSLISNSTLANQTSTGSGEVSSFTSTGYTTNLSGFNSTDTYASWTFRKQPKFFDIQTCVVDGSGFATVNHNLGSVPGCIFVKLTTTTDAWWVYHQSLPTPSMSWLKLNTTDAVTTATGGATRWTVSSTSASTILAGVPGATAVFYLFAHNAGGFGLTGTDNVISCGSFTTDGSGNATVNLGYEPQWVMCKASSGLSDWFIFDNMRGWAYGDSYYLRANSTPADTNTGPNITYPTATGFQVNDSTFDASKTYIYIAIRRGPMKTPTSGTSVYNATTWTGNNTTGRTLATGLSSPPDLAITQWRNGLQANLWWDMLRGFSTTAGSDSIYLRSQETTAESPIANYFYRPDMVNVGFGSIASSGVQLNGSSSTLVGWFLRRAPGFFDEVCFTATGSTFSVTHNLGVAPELVITKERNGANAWYTYSATYGYQYYLSLNGINAKAGPTAFFGTGNPTSTTLSLSGGTSFFSSGQNYVAYLFASCPGVSKVGSYTGTGATQTINCGFTGGARFVLIKRTDSTGDWYVWDTARGMVSGTDPSLLLNSSAAEVNANSVYTTSVGFQIVSTAAGINASGGSYIFLAIA